MPPYVMVDCSHGNSQKDHLNQPKVAASLASQIRSGCRAIAGVMLESHLVAGSQPANSGKPLAYGQSITDPCLDWATTTVVLEELAEAARVRMTKSE
jgi:3-deoxy-7-phosphoheptulonate synthase